MTEQNKGNALEPETVETVENTEIEDTIGEGENSAVELKKYTDKDVDAIVSKRLARERKKIARELEGKEQLSELEKRERDITVREWKADAKLYMAENGLPTKLADILNYNDEETYKESLESVTGIVREIVKDLTEKGIKKALVGRTPTASCGSPKTSDDLLADIFNK